ncbi:hypothetical protein GCM10011529_25100 [Polymorphobacter glacialis]|uniref:REDY-like protein HapK n=1 Tax=Sandarakinorhabdus glacialis TaxID=1614636 RepID=A0A917EB22_9SPHN|nr:REDY-like protein HapK [Polymorphobacter glacialis]GGE17584.1 hypothetical protein GCM10011529_25100 [Polymorphobacter glacialis]
MKIIMLFNLKVGVSAEDYEAWAKARDIPSVRALPSVDDFQVYRTTGVLGGKGVPLYAYVEVIDVPDMEGFGTDMASAAIQDVLKEFEEFADTPAFILTEPLSLA